MAAARSFARAEEELARAARRAERAHGRLLAFMVASGSSSVVLGRYVVTLRPDGVLVVSPAPAVAPSGARQLALSV